MKAALYITDSFGQTIAMTKPWEKPPFSSPVKENVGEGSGLSASKSCSSWAAPSQRGKKSTRPSGAGPGGFSHFHFPALPVRPGRRQCERGCHCLTQHVPKPQESSDVYKKLDAHSYQIRGISRSFLHCLDNRGSPPLSLLFTFSVSMASLMQFLWPYSL